MTPHPDSANAQGRQGAATRAAPAIAVILAIAAVSLVGILTAPSRDPVVVGESPTWPSTLAKDPSGPLAQGKFLVARPGMPDPNFSRTVVLLLSYGTKGTRGLIVNRPTEARLSMLAPKLEELADREDPVYRGGPVQPWEMSLLVRSPSRKEGAQHVFDDVFVSESPEVLRRLATAGPDAVFRVYAGYAGWAPGQLESEVARGDWHVVPGSADIVFAEPASEEVWRGLLPREGSEWSKKMTPPERWPPFHIARAQLLE
jgi:putative transcriptional regulator